MRMIDAFNAIVRFINDHLAIISFRQKQNNKVSNEEPVHLQTAAMKSQTIDGVCFRESFSF
jgi:hypothetical protein